MRYPDICVKVTEELKDSQPPLVSKDDIANLLHRGKGSFIFEFQEDSSKKVEHPFSRKSFGAL